jgi:AAA+ superfamily predicted ATPase
VEEKPDVTYNDVGGCKEALEKLREVVELPLLHPEKFVALGIDPPKGILLYGPPGTGKTLSARAVANRTDACFIRVIGSELVQKYVGEGARMVRELFQMARSKKACIVFFDEVDAIGTSSKSFCMRVHFCTLDSLLLIIVDENWDHAHKMSSYVSSPIHVRVYAPSYAHTCADLRLLVKYHDSP